MNNIRVESTTIETNCYLLEEDGHVIIIDPSDCAEPVFERLEKEGWTADYIFLTHEHYDHIWDLEKVREHYGIPVVACELCSERIQSISSNLSSICDILIYFKKGVVPEEKGERFTCNAADITFDETYEMEWHGHSFTFQRLPGHSPGSVLIRMDGEAVFTGDYMLLGEEDMTRLKGGSDEDYKTIARPTLDAIPKGTHIYPGHGVDYLK